MSTPKNILCKITISDLKIPALIGTNDWEKKHRQTLILNISLIYSATWAIKTDNLSHALDYKALKKSIIAFVKNSRVELLERLTHEVLNLVMNNPNVLSVTVRIDKPHALRFAKSVSAEISQQR